MEVHCSVLLLVLSRLSLRTTDDIATVKSYPGVADKCTADIMAISAETLSPCLGRSLDFDAAVTCRPRCGFDATDV